MMDWLRFLKVFVLLSHFFTQSTQWVVDDTGCRTPDRNTGDCISVHSCSTMIDFILKTNTTLLDNNSKKYLRTYLCGSDAAGVKVCCPRTPIDLNDINSIQNRTSNLQASIKKLILLNINNSKFHLESFLHEESYPRNVELQLKMTGSALDSNHVKWSMPKIWCQSAGREIPKELCIQLTRYLTAINETENGEIESVFNLYECGKNAEGPKVCCPEQVEDPTYHPNLKLLPNSECVYNHAADPNQVWMHRGDFAGLFEFPWMVALKYSVRRDGGEEEDFRCGATLISSRYLITAAHCVVTKRISLIGARLGEIDINNSDKIPIRLFASQPQDPEINAEDAIVHPNYDPTSMANDIALIRLRENVETSVSISPICLPIRLKSRSNKFKRKVTVTGWGETESGVRSTKLLKIDIPVMPPQNCTKYYEGIMNVTTKQLCAGGKDERVTCRGDSGGPLMTEVDFDLETKTVLYGVVSFGPKQCAKRNSPAVYTRVTSHLNWILDNMKP